MLAERAPVSSAAPPPIVRGRFASASHGSIAWIAIVQIVLQRPDRCVLQTDAQFAVLNHFSMRGRVGEKPAPELSSALYGAITLGNQLFGSCSSSVEIWIVLTGPETQVVQAARLVPAPVGKLPSDGAKAVNTAKAYGKRWFPNVIAPYSRRCSGAGSTPTRPHRANDQDGKLRIILQDRIGSGLCRTI